MNIVLPELACGPNQEHLVQVLKCLFPSDEQIIESRKASSLKYDSTGGYVELDIWLPKYNLCFEFQDTYHYVDAWYSHKRLDKVQQADGYKKITTHKRGISLIEVPCWWDGSLNKLVASIKFYRPDLFQVEDAHEPISLNPPNSQFSSFAIPDVGELMLASFPESRAFMDSNFNWWLGEKYDGIRCCWNPRKRKMYTRTGKNCELLPCINVNLPNIFLDAELWFGRGNFSHAQRLVTGGEISFVKWNMLRINAFDIPSRELQFLPFEERYSFLLSHSLSLTPLLMIVPRILCDKEAIFDFAMNSVIKKGGEGIILRSVGSLYEHGRTDSLLKLKGYQGDKDAVVVGIASNKSVTLKLANGTIFSVPQQNVKVPRITTGDVVTFSYENFAKKSEFVNPTIFRIRTDVNWPEVAYNSKGEDAKTWNREQEGERERKSARKFWNEKLMRRVLEDIAKKKEMDPLLPDTWFHISPSDIEQVEGGRTILQHFKGYVPALQALFPDIGLHIDELSQFYSLNKWHDVRNRRKFFEKIASSLGFNPLVPENWYHQSREKIMAFKGASTILRYYNGNISRALTSIFPDIGLNRTTLYYELSESANKKRKFFEDYAREHSFDPLDPENWYSQSPATILSTKGAQAILHSYNNNIPNALCNIFPDIGLIKSHFETWKQRNEQRRFFEVYAQQNSLDPYNPDHWYTQSRERILAIKGAHAILRHYEGSVAKALVNIFPEIGLEKSKLLKRNYSS